MCGGGARVRTRFCVDDQGKNHPVVKCIDMLRTQDLLKIVMMGGAMEEKDEELCNKQDCGKAVDFLLSHIIILYF